MAEILSLVLERHLNLSDSGHFSWGCPQTPPMKIGPCAAFCHMTCLMYMNTVIEKIRASLPCYIEMYCIGIVHSGQGSN